MTEACLGDDTIVEFMEQRAGAAVRARVEEHASRCAACREVLSSLARSGPPVAAASEPELAAHTRVGRYEIVKPIGAGGMGVVYAAHDPELDRVVAVKLLRSGSHPELQQRLRREARAMAQLVHPNVVTVYDVGSFDGRIFIAMEYVPGETLLHWVAGSRTPAEILAAYIAAGQGLAAAHAAGIVHRDFKPENVLIGRDGRARVGDFGLARSDIARDAALADTALQPSAAMDAHDTIDMRELAVQPTVTSNAAARAASAAADGATAQIASAANQAASAQVASAANQTASAQIASTANRAASAATQAASSATHASPTATHAASTATHAASTATYAAAAATQAAAAATHAASTAAHAASTASHAASAATHSASPAAATPVRVAPTPVRASGSARLPELTEPGTLLGTPYYMAPELYTGRDADARSDQFAFCVALYTAIAGERPLINATFDARNAARRAARLHELPNARRLPRRVRAAIQRGLATNPAARFDSLPDLLAQLAPRSRRWIPVAAALVAALSVIAWLVLRGAPDERCTGGPAAFATTWNVGQRAATTAALLTVGRPYALAAIPQVESALDRYAVRWADAHRDACRATRIRGDQTEALLALRMTCLERRRQDAAALIDTLARADATIATGATDAVAKLNDLSACADVAALQQIVPPPRDPAARITLAALSARLAEAGVADNVGAYATGLAQAREVSVAAHALGYRPFEAEANLLEGQLAYDAGDNARAETALDAAIWAAEVGRHDEIAARAWTLLVFVVGYDKAEYARGLAFVPRATAALARLGGNPEIEANLERALGAIDADRSQLDTAVAHFQKAVAIAERAFGPASPVVVRALNNLGMAVMSQGHSDRAIEIHRRVLALSAQLYSPEHPAYARALNTLGNAYYAAADYAAAEREIRRALAIREAALGPVHPDIASTFADLARAVRRQGRIEEAIALDRRSVAMGEQAFGPEHPAFAQQLFGLGASLGRAGHFAEAEQALFRAEAIFTKLHGAEHVDTVRTRVARGDLRMYQSRWREAAALYAAALPVLERSPEAAGDALGDALVNLGTAWIELGAPDRAFVPLEHLAEHLDQLPADLRVDVELTLARALWDSGRDRRRAHALALEARILARSRPDTDPANLAKIERWIATH